MNNTTTAPVSAALTPTMDALLASMQSHLTAREFWALAGWAAHIRVSRHAIHTANSWAKHRGEFAGVSREAEALTVARIYDFGESTFSAVALCAERIQARAEKEAS